VSYWARVGKPGFVALTKPGHEVEHPHQIHRLEPDERLDCGTSKPLRRCWR
jgi:hypothetical protein